MLSVGGAFSGFVLGALFLPMVMFGLHQILTPIHIQMIGETGKTLLLPILAMAGAGQVGAFALWMKLRKDKELTEMIKGAFTRWDFRYWRTINLRGNVAARSSLHHCLYRWRYRRRCARLLEVSVQLQSDLRCRVDPIDREWSLVGVCSRFVSGLCWWFRSNLFLRYS